MRKKIFSVLLIAAFILGMIPMFASADTGISEKGEYTYTLSTDPDTGETIPPEFGTPENNGRIWTDKSVLVNDDHFDVNLKVLAQEYVSSYGSVETHSIAADVVMILDFTSSMLRPGNEVEKEDGTKVTRMEAMVDSVNKAIDIITNTNPNNRIQVIAFYGKRDGTATNNKPTAECIMPLAHYTSSSTSEDPIDKYITFTNHSSGTNYTARIAASDTLMKDGEVYDFYKDTGTGTCTQFGIVRGVKQLIDAINAEPEHTVDRKPYVIMLTDGEPTWCSRNWTDTDEATLKQDYINYSTANYSATSTNHNNQKIAAYTILSAALMRDRLIEAYTAYNGKDLGSEWFNIGLKVKEQPNYTGCLVKPAYLKDVTPNGNSQNGVLEAQRVKYYLDGEAKGAKIWTAKDYSEDYNYVYTYTNDGNDVNNGDGYVTFADTYEVLDRAFTDLANIIRLGSAEYTIPIVNHEGSGEIKTDVEFTDVIGEGMYVTDITLKPNGAPPVQGEDDDGDGVFTFEEYETTVTLTEDANGQETLVWKLPAKEVAMFTFADRTNLNNGEYIPADPTTLTYGVDFTNDIEEGPAYTNAFDSDKNPLTTVTYEIPGDNDYYFNVVKDDETQNFVSSTMKPGLNLEIEKTDNTTDTAANSHAYEYEAQNGGTADSSASVTGHLGNNGKASFHSKKSYIDISVEKKWEDEHRHPIEDTSDLPAVTVHLCRKADGSPDEETVQTFTLSNSNGYRKDFEDLPIRDSSDKRYSYYIKEECPEGYFIAHMTDPLRAYDGTLSVTNRVLPPSGMITVKKQWKNKLGATIYDLSSMPSVHVRMKRHVTEITPDKYTLTVTLTDNGGRGTTYTLPVKRVIAGSEVTFTLRAYIRRQNTANGATLRLNNNTVPWDPSTVTGENEAEQFTYYIDYENQLNPLSNNKFWGRQATQTVTVNSNTTLNYVCSATLNTTNITNYDPCQLLFFTGEPPEDPAGSSTNYDEVYDNVTIDGRTGWRMDFSDLPLTEYSSPKVYDSNRIYKYTYYAEEVAVPGYTASYTNNDGISEGEIIITNKSDSPIGPLPETGGEGNSGTARVIGFFAILISAAVFLIRVAIPYYKKKLRRIFIR